MSGDGSSTESCRELRNAEYDAYYFTVVVSVGLKDAFGTDRRCSFKVNEPTMYTAASKEVHPDAIFQCDNDTKGIVCEIKSSLPHNQKQMLHDLREQIGKYAEIETGWKTSSGKIREHSILLLVRKVDAGRARALMRGNTSGASAVVTNICLGHWEEVKIKGRHTQDVIRLGLDSGSTGCKYFDRLLTARIDVPMIGTHAGYERRMFVRAQPPDLYMLAMLYQNILPAIAGNRGYITVTVEDIKGRLDDYYPSWSELRGEQSQVRTRWIKRALRTLCQMKLARELHGGRYRIDALPRKKNIKDFLLDKMCSGNMSVVQTTLDDH